MAMSKKNKLAGLNHALNNMGEWELLERFAPPPEELIESTMKKASKDSNYLNELCIDLSIIDPPLEFMDGQIRALKTLLKIVKTQKDIKEIKGAIEVRKNNLK